MMKKIKFLSKKIQPIIEKTLKYKKTIATIITVGTTLVPTFNHLYNKLSNLKNIDKEQQVILDKQNKEINFLITENESIKQDLKHLQDKIDILMKVNKNCNMLFTTNNYNSNIEQKALFNKNYGK